MNIPKWSHSAKVAISNPSEILRVIQNKSVKGRNLEVQRVDEVSEGMTQYILVHRKSILETAFEELKEFALTDLQKSLRVDFYGEVVNTTFNYFDTVPPESMDPSGCGKTSSLPRAPISRPPQVKICSTAVKTSATTTLKIPRQNRRGNTSAK